MARFKDWNGPLPVGKNGGPETWEMVQIAVMMDIRDELKALNRVMQCPNVIAGFRALTSINKRMGKFDALKLRKPK